jgi:phosphate transport system substrate-binding protein
VKADSSGVSLWCTPRLPIGRLLPSSPAGQVRASLEGLIRFDRLEPDRDKPGVKERWIGGLAYWPRMNVTSTQINGSGATFPYPLYSAWFAAYARIRPDVQINYIANGSGAGIRQLSEQITFFGGTDTPMNEEGYQAALGRVLHLPTVVGAVAAIYHLPGFKGPLRLNGEVLAAIFLGRIRSWNDPAIVRLNPDVTLPPFDITLIYRSDSSGTSYIVGDFLSKRSEEWRRLFGANRTLRPQVGIGVGARGSEGVSTLVRQTPGGLGYVELGYALRDKIDRCRRRSRRS